MSLTKTRFSKTILALALALILVASLAPVMNYQASAATYYAATGVVTDAGMSTITILSSGKYRHFSKEDAKISDPYKKGLALGDTVQIIYNAAHPKIAVQIKIIAHNPSGYREEHKPESQLAVMGTVRDIGMSTISVLMDGRRYTFSQEDAHIVSAPDDGIMIGDKVRVTYYRSSADRAVQVLFMKKGPNHDDNYEYQWSGTSTVANRSFTGWIPDMDGSSVVVQDLQTGKSLQFYYDDEDGDLPEIAIGDVVKVLYNDRNPGYALRIIMVDQGTNH